MSANESAKTGDDKQVGKVRTAWHPLLVNLLRHYLENAYSVESEVPVGKQPLRLDVALIRREELETIPDARQIAPDLVKRLNLRTLIELKGPTDSLESGDLDQICAYAHLYRSQQTERINQKDLTLIILAPSLTTGFGDELECANVQLRQESEGISRLEGTWFQTYLFELDRTGRQNPLLSLFSKRFLKDAGKVAEELSPFVGLFAYFYQQVEQFRGKSKEFVMQYANTPELAWSAEEARRQLFSTCNVEEVIEILKKLPIEEVLSHLPPEDRLKGLPPKKLLEGLSPEQREQLRKLLK